LHEFSGPLSQKWKFWGKTVEGCCNFHPANSLWLLGMFTSVPILVKIDHEMRLWEWALTDRQTDAHMESGFVICKWYSYGEIKIGTCGIWTRNISKYTIILLQNLPTVIDVWIARNFEISVSVTNKSANHQHHSYAI